jgi:hypothetical protein
MAAALMTGPAGAALLTVTDTTAESLLADPL